MPEPLSPERPLRLKGPNGPLAAVLHAASPHRLVLMAHGFTGTKVENGRLFVQTARALASRGISALRFDFWGSGESGGEFCDMSPNTEIADLHFLIRWATRRYPAVGVLGLSFGGAVSICTCVEHPEVGALVTWSSVPSFRSWRNDRPPGRRSRNPLEPGPQFWSDRPRIDVPEAYARLAMPKLQIQGDQDLPSFLERFREYFPNAAAPKKHLVLRGADHVFTTWSHRRTAIARTAEWFDRWLKPAA